MYKDLTSRKSSEDTRLAAQEAEKEAKDAAVAADKARKQAQMRAEIDESIRSTRERVLNAIRASMEEDAREHETFKKKLAEMEAAEAAAASRRRDNATAFRKLWMQEAQDKKRAAVERTQTLRKEAAHEAEVAAGGPADEEFHREVAKLVAEEEAKGHDTLPLLRLVHKVTHPVLMPNLQRM
jgi:hypothetical protein